jgi:hypothetical protein
VVELDLVHVEEAAPLGLVLQTILKGAARASSSVTKSSIDLAVVSEYVVYDKRLMPSKLDAAFPAALRKPSVVDHGRQPKGRNAPKGAPSCRRTPPLSGAARARNNRAREGRRR